MPPPTVIENPIINSPFREPTRYFKFDEDGITNIQVEGRRPSSYFVPIANPKKKGKQNTLETQWTKDREKESDDINRIRQRVSIWRQKGWPDVTPTTRMLLEHWTNPDRERKLFFCQVEALETLIYINEASVKAGDAWIENRIKEVCQVAGTPLYRQACKMATGTGKTFLMAMLVAWQTLNKRANPNSPHFTDAFLIVTPGITVRDRLRVLLPSDQGNYYQALDIVPAEHMANLGTAKIIITNFHTFKPKQTQPVSDLKHTLLGHREGFDPFTETLEQMVNRVCSGLGKKKKIIVLNDEAHHCYRSKPEEVTEKLTGDDKKEAQAREEEARLWLTGLEAVHAKIGIKNVYDLSATPFYLRGSGYPEGTLFPWVVSDFSLIDAIESGLVKIPRVPVADNAMIGDFPTYRDLWYRIRDGLPKKGRGTDAVKGAPHLPQELQGALESLYAHYERQYKEWEVDTEGQANGSTPPVFIVVCNNTNVSKLVYDFVSGYETEHHHPDGAPKVSPGKFDIFSNVKDNRWLAKPSTILVDSEQFDGDAGMTPEFKKLVGHLIDDFKNEYRQRFPGRDVDAITDEDIMREVLNTVGKKDKLGEHVKCVVSVSMLTEGWDANTVTHILGVRAFGTQLLCEQVVGRGLRRVSYHTNEQGFFEPEYAEVYGVPFSFIPCAGSTEGKKAAPRPKPGRVKAIPERLIECPWLLTSYPRVTGYRWELPPQRLSAKFNEESKLILSTQDFPTETINAPIVGKSETLTLDKLKDERPQTIDFEIAKLILERHFPKADDRTGHVGEEGPKVAYQVDLFPQLLSIVRQWRENYVVITDDTFPQLLLFVQKAHAAAEKIYKAIVSASEGQKRLRAEMQPYDPVGNTSGVTYDTVKTVWQTDPKKCHLNLVPQDSGWESKFCQSIESLKFVKSYVKNQNLGFTIPYSVEGRPGNYYPDYILKIDDGHGMDDLLHLIIEITGERKKEKQAKVTTAETLWVPSVNNEGIYGRWAFLEIINPYLAKTMITEFIKAPFSDKAGD